MFVDEAFIHVKAGDGGSGCVSFRREKFVPKGGPEGGDGGDGGNVIFVADPSENTLMEFAGRHNWKAERGQDGMGKRMAGHNGADLVIKVPPGTMIFDAEHNILLADVTDPATPVVICRRGRGGRGNWHFRSPTNQAPRFAEPGTEGQERDLRLELKLIADVGLVGLPNAGKSTLLSSISAARPKVADYPFTTLKPELGIAEISGLSGDRRLVVADLPGLIEGAQHGAGLGHAFLRHIERTKVIVHVVDMYPIDGSDPYTNYRTIRKELEAFSKKLAKKKEIIAANKMDLNTDNGEALKKFKRKLRGKVVYPIAGGTKQGVDELLRHAWEILQSQRAEDTAATKAAEPAPAPRIPPHRMPQPEAASDESPSGSTVAGGGRGGRRR
jgi:GTP-binding protein